MVGNELVVVLLAIIWGFLFLLQQQPVPGWWQRRRARCRSQKLWSSLGQREDWYKGRRETRGFRTAQLGQWDRRTARRDNDWWGGHTGGRRRWARGWEVRDNPPPLPLLRRWNLLYLLLMLRLDSHSAAAGQRIMQIAHMNSDSRLIQFCCWLSHGRHIHGLS